MRLWKLSTPGPFSREYERCADHGVRLRTRMFEAYGKNKYVSTGVIQWMLNNAVAVMIGTSTTITWTRS